MSVFRFIRWIAEGEKVQLNGDGSQERDFTYVDDIAEGTLAAALGRHGYEVINLGSDSPVQLTSVIERLERLMGKRANIEQRPAQAADVQATWADISKARTVLGWEPRTTLDEGLRRATDWYRENWALASSIDLP